jgi:hypothetical protein
LELVKVLQHPEVDILDDVRAVQAGDQTLAEQTLGLPAYPGAQLRKQVPQGLLVTLSGLGQEAGQFFVIVHAWRPSRRAAAGRSTMGWTQAGVKALHIPPVLSPSIIARAVPRKRKRGIVVPHSWVG